jgi:N utilization substance protein B
MLYQADVTGQDPVTVLEEWRASGRRVSAFAEDLVEGVDVHLGELDEVIGRHAEEWTVDRMAALDRTILRTACYELLFRPDVPAAAAIAEAVEGAKELSTDDSGRFVNGVLGRIWRVEVERSEDPGDRRPAGEP